MKVAACVLNNTKNIIRALQDILVFTEAASKLGCDLIVFPEACIGNIDLSGYFNNDVTYGISYYGKVVQKIEAVAKQCKIAVGIGFIENYVGRLYDSYMIIDKYGETILHYRRISEGWKPDKHDKMLYCSGTDVVIADTEWGKISVLLCGDLFQEDIRKRLIGEPLRLLLHPMARAFPFSIDIQDKWDNEEFPWYLAEYKKFTFPILVVNCVEKPIANQHFYCGGAWWVENQQVCNSKGLRKPGLLIVER